MTRIADSSFLLTLFDFRDPRRVQALAWMADPDPVQVPVEVLGETLGLVHRRQGYEMTVTIWRDLRATPHVQFLQAASTEQTSAIFLEGRGKLSWVDAAVVAACRAASARPLCFDPDIVRFAAS